MLGFRLHMLMSSILHGYFVALDVVFGLEACASKYALKKAAERPAHGIEAADDNRFIKTGMPGRTYEPFARIYQNTLGFLVVLPIDCVTSLGSGRILCRRIKTESTFEILPLEFVDMKCATGISAHARKITDPAANGSEWAFHRPVAFG